MTDSEKDNKTELTSVKIKNGLTLLITSVISIFISTLLAPHILKYVNDGLRLCFNVIIGSVFPFLILTDIIICTSHFENIKWLRLPFEKLFKINGCAISAFLIGIICGFPIGVKVSADLYKNGYISKNECERLIGFSNNTGPAFIISGIGFGMRGSIRDGIILYISMVVSAIISGLISGRNKKPSSKKTSKFKTNYNFSASVKSSALNTLYICAFIVLFSIVCGLVKSIVTNELLFSLIIPFIEVSNSAKILSKASLFSRDIGLILTSFAISFSGISVHMQAKSFLLGTDISMRFYYVTKFLQGCISAVITSIIILI